MGITVGHAKGNLRPLCVVPEAAHVTSGLVASQWLACDFCERRRGEQNLGALLERQLLVDFWEPKVVAAAKRCQYGDCPKQH